MKLGLLFLFATGCGGVAFTSEVVYETADADVPEVATYDAPAATTTTPARDRDAAPDVGVDAPAVQTCPASGCPDAADAAAVPTDAGVDALTHDAGLCCLAAGGVAQACDVNAPFLCEYQPSEWTQCNAPSCTANKVCQTTEGIDGVIGACP
jgi:hypothetical protein